ncbi:sensor histidine kinase KdpD [Bacteroides helcogenes]|uniref:histidine kinase n=1 Tax=Bacteroides helcogenes (strain ATCC 35417 / DSM 20613 / JCM 6297 / CCUG 15421 / P 36-108) TaxID=693979 RepID=E6STS9_BACT6|nr:HAMP domain-containing sensor histidine kinase [Bacteroides helcogenes]ADV42282.1 integral membrane sensor signal transduction histidine kinase [Bacteroides helcogenes P 36-108]MDY5237264.1 HAMP domain-containing sensor histidine kinase [Bacteroides helcogenes]
MKKKHAYYLLLLLCLPFIQTGAQSNAQPGSITTDKTILLLHRRAEQATARKDYQQAAIYYKQLHDFSDSLHTESTLQDVKLLKDSIQLQELHMQNAQLKSHLMHQTLAGALALCIFFTAIYLLASRRVKRLKQRKEKVTLQIQELKRTTANKALFLSNMSHEIRTPLNALAGFSDILCTMDMDADSCKQFNDIIQLNSQLLIKLIDDVVDLSTLDLNNMKFNLEKTDAVALCRGVVESIQQIKQTDAEISFKTELEYLPLNTDSQRLQQVLINIIVNATKFCKQGSITLALELREEKAYFTVTDTGCGIPLEQQSKVFGRFEKLNEHADGTGLGLSICEIIIKYLGGNIGIDPDYTSGTRFFFTHPILKE